MNLLRRPRRLRSTPQLRALVRETELSPEDFILPLFVSEKVKGRVPVNSMPGVFQLDENELEFDSEGTRLQDLVLQTTFDEWQDYVAAQQAEGGAVQGCVDCHMPLQTPQALVPSSPR